MEKIDRLGWAAGFSFTSYGVQVGVRTNDPSVLAEVRACLPHGARLSKPAGLDLLYSFRRAEAPRRKGLRAYHLLYEESVQVARSEDFDLLLQAFRDHAEFAIPQISPRHIFVHAGVVGWRDSAIVLPGRSFTGKSRLVAAMVKAGATYYSDEFAVLDRDGLVHPYTRPLSLRQDGEGKGVPTPVEAIGGKKGSKPIPVAAVVSATFKDGARWRPRHLPAGTGILELLANTVPARRRPAESLAFLKQAAAGARFLKGTRGDADEIAGKLLKLVGQ
jgi:hypothetical protein